MLMKWICYDVLFLKFQICRNNKQTNDILPNGEKFARHKYGI